MIHTARLNVTCVQDLISDRLITENLQAETVSKMVLSISERVQCLHRFWQACSTSIVEENLIAHL